MPIRPSRAGRPRDGAAGANLISSRAPVDLAAGCRRGAPMTKVLTLSDARISGHEGDDMTDVLGIYSCDDHLDMHAEPPDVWSARLSGADAERGPHVVEQEGQRVWMCEGRALGQSGR